MCGNEHDNIRVLHTSVNSGAGGARNVALANVQGEYISD